MVTFSITSAVVDIFGRFKFNVCAQRPRLNSANQFLINKNEGADCNNVESTSDLISVGVVFQTLLLLATQFSSFLTKPLETFLLMHCQTWTN